LLDISGNTVDKCIATELAVLEYYSISF